MVDIDVLIRELDSSVGNVMETKDVWVRVAGVDLEVGCPQFESGGRNVDAVLGGLSHEFCLRHSQPRELGNDF